MKKLIVIALCLLPLLSVAQFDPYIPTSKSNPYYEDSVSISRKVAEKKVREVRKAAGGFEYTGGYYLQKASSSMLTGMILPILGTGVMYTGLLIYENDNSPNKTTAAIKPYYYAGGVMVLAGMFYSIRGIVLIGKAGKAFDANDKGKTALYLQPRPNGAALVLRF